MLEHGAEEVGALSLALAARVGRAERWFAQLPGRVEATVRVDDPARPGDYWFDLRLTRSSWTFDCRYACKHLGEAAAHAWRPVRESSLDAKMATIAALPLLLAKMTEAQDVLCGRLRAASIAFDSFAAVAGIEEEES